MACTSPAPSWDASRQALSLLRLQIVYHLLSLQDNARVRVKSCVDEALKQCTSVASPFHSGVLEGASYPLNADCVRLHCRHCCCPGLWETVTSFANVWLLPCRLSCYQWFTRDWPVCCGRSPGLNIAHTGQADPSLTGLLLIADRGLQQPPGS